ncbi:MAG: sigma 54-interacting transcriptional regulator, partial [Smithellaceae bacterium]|nr:sigma 54-interacting transcriptional regulator [Smithellaceae bacterium]
ATDPRISDYDRFLTSISNQGSYFCSPLKIENEVIGIIAVWCREETRFYPEEINLFLAFANQISIIIHSARLFEKNLEKIHQLTALQEAVAAMNQSYQMDNHIHDVLVEWAKKIAGVERALVYFWDIEKDRCLINDGERVTVEDRGPAQEIINGSIIRKAIEANRIIIRQPDESSPPLFAGYGSEMALPLSIKDKFKGALYVASKSVRYSQDLVNVMDILVKNAAVSYDNAIMHSLISLEARNLKTEVVKLKEREDILLGFHNIIGKSRKIMDIFHLIQEVADHNTNILVQGESGTGKELIARAIHRQSNRAAKPFVSINCAAIPGNLLESELFGYEAGAFTDAKKRKLGIIDSANGGTLLLDEIGDMSIHIQAKFLRVLEEGSLRRLGGTDNVPLDVRFIFSTNKELTKMVQEGTFREDLFYRISVLPITIPPLRERQEDIGLLASHYLEEFNRKFKKNVKGFSYDAEYILRSHPWPGNVRELRNIIERIMILQRGDSIITLDNLPSEVKSVKLETPNNLALNNAVFQLPSAGIDYTAATDNILSEIKGKIIAHALQESRGNKTRAAGLLGISRYKLIREQKKIGSSLR